MKIKSPENNMKRRGLCTAYTNMPTRVLLRNSNFDVTHQLIFLFFFFFFFSLALYVYIAKKRGG